MVFFDPTIADVLLTYARRVVARGYIHNTLGNIAVRTPAAGFDDGVVYTKHAGISLEEMTRDHVVITDVPTGRLLHGDVPTSVGHQLNREILRLRPDVNAVIHVHHDETIAYFAASPGRELRILSIELPSVMGRPPHVLPSHVIVELDVPPTRALQHTRSGRRRAALAAPAQLLPHQRRSRRQRRQLLVALIARRPAEATIGIHGQLLGRRDLEHAADPARHVLGRVLVEALHVDDARAQLAAVAVLPPQVELGQLAAGELEHELIGGGLERAREVRLVGPRDARAAEAIAGANVEAEPRLHALGGQVEEPRHLLSGNVAARRLVDLDPVGAGRHQRTELLVDDLGEPLGDVDRALVDLAGMDARAEGERPGAGRLRRPLRV